MIVDIFIPCFIDQLYPQTGFNMIKILEKFDVEPVYNENQTCCGQISFNSGFWDDAKAIVEKFILEFNHNRPVIVPSASCAGFVRNYYGELLEWTGWAIATWSLAGASFAIWTFANLVPRALASHKWYIRQFPEYPKNRKAVIPYLL